MRQCFITAHTGVGKTPKLNAITPGVVSRMQSPSTAPAITRAPRRKHWSRRRKVATIFVALMLLAPFAAAGIYVWQISNAIENVQDNSVVDLPDHNITLGGVRTPTAESDVAQADDAPAATASTVADSTAESFDGQAADEQDDTENAQEPTEPSQAQAEPTEGPKRDDSNPGSFTIIRDIVGTGTGSDRVDPREAWPGQDHINVLVLGVDTREAEGDQNADVIMIARVDFDDNAVRAVSIPRDLEVEVPGHGRSKINGAYNIGVNENPDSQVAGVAMMRDTIEYNFGIPIDEYVLIDFEGFTEVIDAVGGITIVVPERIEDDAYPTEDYGTRKLVIEAGRQKMDGETALAYARTRHQDSDDKRRERQMLVLRALLEKAQSLGSVTRITQVIKASGDAALTSLDWQEQLALVGTALKLDQDNVVFGNITEPMVTPGTSESGQWIYVGDPTVIGTYIEDILSGVPPEEADPSGT